MIIHLRIANDRDHARFAANVEHSAMRSRGKWSSGMRRRGPAEPHWPAVRHGAVTRRPKREAGTDRKGGETVENRGVTVEWRTSSYSPGDGGQCVEVAGGAGV